MAALRARLFVAKQKGALLHIRSRNPRKQGAGQVDEVFMQTWTLWKGMAGLSLQTAKFRPSR